MKASAVASPESRTESVRREEQTIELLTRARDAQTTEAEAEQCRDLAVQLNLPVADGLARRYRSRGEDLDDLVQVARLGLVHAVNRFEPGSGAFLSFAVPTITGEIKRHFRDHCWTVRPPRRLQELHSEVMAGWSDLAQEQAATPSAKDIADRIGANRADVNEVMHSNAFTSSSLDNPEASQWMAAAIGHQDGGFDAVDDALEHEDLMKQVRVACEVLSDEDRRLLTMRFVDCASQSVIAAELGISQMSVSRRLRKITNELRDEIERRRPSTPDSVARPIKRSAVVAA